MGMAADDNDTTTDANGNDWKVIDRTAGDDGDDYTVTWSVTIPPKQG